MQHRISFQQIDYFLTVAESLSFTEAAKILYISQPALSKQISVIEKELGFPLFQRDKRNVALTPEGASLYIEWSKLVKQMDASIYNAKQISHNAIGELTIGCTDTFDYSDILPPLVREFAVTYPEVTIDVSSHSFRTLREGFLADKFDLLLTPYFELEDMSDVEWIRLKDIPLSIIVPTSNSLSEKDHVSIYDLKDENFILISPKESPHGVERTQALCRRFGFNMKNIKHVANLSSMELAVQNGLGVALCNSKKFENAREFCRIYPIELDLDDSFLVAVWKKGKRNVCLDLFASMLISKFPNTEFQK